MSLDEMVEKLSGNFPEERKEGMSMLDKYFTFLHDTKQEIPPEGATSVWEGLFYAMWFQDKPVRQEALSKDISGLIHKLPTFHSQLVFLKSHFSVMSSHWSGLDKIRIDKFLLLVRDMLRETVGLLNAAAWSQKHISKFHQALKASILDVEHMDSQLVFHFCDIYLDELKKVADGKLKKKLVFQMIQPFVHLIARVPPPILSHMSKAIFDEEACHVPRNFGQLAKVLFERASQIGVRKKNRLEIYRIVQRYRNLEKGLPARPEPDLDLGKELDMEDVEKAAMRLLKEKRKADQEEEVSRKKRKRKNTKVESEPEVIDLDYEAWLETKDNF